MEATANPAPSPTEAAEAKPQHPVWAKFRLGVWRYFGATFLEEKDGIQAISLHKSLGLIMFIWCLYQWTMQNDVADAAVYTLWGLLAMRGSAKIVELLKGY